MVARVQAIIKTQKDMIRVYEMLAEGFEEIEALMPVDVLRRGGIDIQTVSVAAGRSVRSSHGVAIEADLVFSEADFSLGDMVLLPGGLPGATNLDAHAGVRQVLAEYAAHGKRIGAICAAPLVLGRMGLLRGRRATCYPGFEKYLEGADTTGELFTIDGNVITGRGPAAALDYSIAVLSLLAGGEKAEETASGMGRHWL